MRTFYLIALLLLSGLCDAQDTTKAKKPERPLRDVTKGFVVKTNIANLIVFRRPTISIEKYLSSKMSLEASYLPAVYGSLIAVKARRKTERTGFVLRAKFLFDEPKAGKAGAYFGAYAGTLQRYRKFRPTQNPPTIPEPYSYRVNSIRAGGTFGGQLLEANGLVVDVQASVGYGRWTDRHVGQPGPRNPDYIDVQTWVCFGYHF